MLFLFLCIILVFIYAGINLDFTLKPAQLKKNLKDNQEKEANKAEFTEVLHLDYQSLGNGN